MAPIGLAAPCNHGEEAELLLAYTNLTEQNFAHDLAAAHHPQALARGAQARPPGRVSGLGRDAHAVGHGLDGRARRAAGERAAGPCRLRPGLLRTYLVRTCAPAPAPAAPAALRLDGSRALAA